MPSLDRNLSLATIARLMRNSSSDRSITRPKRVPESYFVLRVALDDIKPPIWRRIVVPASIKLDLLHDVLQIVMGWEDYHLHEFEIDDQRFTENPEEPDQGMSEVGVALGALAHKAKSKFTYLYDFGDGWRHTVTVEKFAAIPDGHAVKITCIAGKRHCPPEDVGGPPGYERYLEIMADPKNPEHASMLQWRGEFDPEEFNLDKINHELAKLVRWSRPRNR